MRREKKQMIRAGRKNSQASRRALIYQQDPLWHQTPEMGVEGLIGTIELGKELQRAIKKEIKKKAKMY